MIKDKVIHIVAKLLEEDSILEMSFHLAEVRKRVRERADTIITHAFKMFCLQNHPSRQWWEREIKDRFDEISEFRAKPRKRHLPKQEYIDYLFNEPLTPAVQAQSTVRGIVRIHNRHHPESMIDLDAVDINAFLAFYRQLLDQHLDEFLAQAI